MDEYIKREDALDAVLFALVGTGHQSRAIEAIRDVPTADVVPKSEVERLQTEIKVLTENSILAKYPCRVLCSKGLILTKSLEEYDKLLADISSEVAREIFEHLECMFSPVFTYTGETIKEYIAELKKNTRRKTNERNV